MIIQYEPHPSQWKIHDALSPPLRGAVVMVIAGRRFGKTVLAINEMVKRALNIPCARIWYVAPSEKQAFMVAWRLMLRPRIDKETGKKLPPYLPEEYILKKREDQHYVELTNGSLIEFKGTIEELYLLGVGLHFVVFDEFPGIPYSVWQDTIAPMLGDYNGDALFIGTVPDPKVHDISMEFINMYEKYLHGNFRNAKAFNFETFDNPYLNHAYYKARVKELEKKGLHADAQRIYYGKYTRQYGSVFPAFSEEKHTILPVDLPRNWLRVYAHDSHPQKPHCGLWCAINKESHYWVYREKEFVTQSGRPMTIDEISYDIMVTENNEHDDVKARFADPTFAKVDLNVTAGRPQSVLDMFRRNGIYFRTADRTFITFFNKMTDMLVDVPEPKIHIFRSCPNTIRQMKDYTWEAWASIRARQEKGTKDKPKKVDDDFVDNLKYIINSGVKPIDMGQISAHRAELNRRWQAEKELL